MPDRTCEIQGCPNDLHGSRFCNVHYRRWKKHGDPLYERPQGRGVCSVDGCTDRVNSHGLCQRHDGARRRHGDPLVVKKKASYASDIVVAVFEAVPGTTCTEWAGAIKDNGYSGQITLNGTRDYPHRHALRLTVGPPPPDTEAAHSCGNRSCVNPHHLRWASRSSNQMDKVGHGTDNRGERHPLHKVTADDVREIRRRMADGEGREAVAAEFGVSAASVSRYVNRTSWAWLD